MAMQLFTRKPQLTLAESLRAGTVKSNDLRPVAAQLEGGAALQQALTALLPATPPTTAAAVLADVFGQMIALGVWSERDAHGVANAASRAVDMACRSDLAKIARDAGL